MRTLRLIALTTVLSIVYHNERVVCYGEEGWENTNSPGDVGHDSTTEPSSNVEAGRNEDQAAAVSPQPDDWTVGEQVSNGMENSVTEPNNVSGWSENPQRANSQSEPKEQDATESTSGDSQHPTSPGDRSADSGSSGVEQSTYYLDTHGDLGFTEGTMMNATTGGDLRNNTESSTQVTQFMENQDQGQNFSTNETPGIDSPWNTTEDPHSQMSTDSGGAVSSFTDPAEQSDSGTTLPSNQVTRDFITTAGKPSHSESSTEPQSSVSPGDGWRQDASEMPYDQATPGLPSDENNWRNDAQGPSTMSYDSASNPPADFDDPQYQGQSPPPDYDLVTLGADYGEIPEDEPDKEGEELVAACKKESNYQGDFQDPNESTTELKCFYACAMVKMDVMNEPNGQMQLNMQTTVNMIEDAFGDNSEMIEKYKSAVSACDQEVQGGIDRCEYAFSFINCGIQKVQSN